LGEGGNTATVSEVTGVTGAVVVEKQITKFVARGSRACHIYRRGVFVNNCRQRELLFKFRFEFHG
jgi:hypothetical protein